MVFVKDENVVFRFKIKILIIGLFLLAACPWAVEAANPLYLPVLFKDYPVANSGFENGRDGSWTESTNILDGNGIPLPLIRTAIRPGRYYPSPGGLGGLAGWRG